MTGRAAIEPRSAIEALRAGVPNRAAIRLLGSDDEPLRQDFVGRLGLCDAALRDGRQVEGIILSGAFGAGKSHHLGYLGELARQEKFVVSLLPISKETPLFDPARLFAAAIRAAVVPDANDDVMTAIMSGLRPKTDGYDELELWTTREVQAGRITPLFAALLYLIPRRATDADDHARMARFFGGGKLSVGRSQEVVTRCGRRQIVRSEACSGSRPRFAAHSFRAAVAARRRICRMVRPPRRDRVDRPV